MIKNKFGKIVVLLLVLTSFVFSEETISKEAYEKLQEANKMLEEKKYKSAKVILNEVLKSENKMEKTYALQSLANIYINQQNYKKVITYYEELISLNTLEKKDIDNMKFSLSQIYMSENMYKKGIILSLELLRGGFQKKNALYENLAIAYYYNEQYKKSIPYIQKLIALKKEKEQWYRMLYSSYIESKNYKGAIKTLKYLVSTYQKEEYWMQLISVYQTTKKYKDSLATLELAYKKGFIKQENNLMYLVSILLQNNLYNKASQYLKTGFDKKIIKNTKRNFDILVSCYLNSKNYKDLIPTLANSKYGNTPKYKILTANIHYTNGNYQGVINTLKDYKFKKNSKYDGQKYIMLSLSSYELDKDKSAKSYLKKASLNKHEKRRALSIASDLGYKI